MPVQCFAAIFRDTDGQVGMIRVEFIKPRRIGINGAAIPAEVLIIADGIGDLQIGMVCGAGSNGCHGGQTGSVHSVNQIIQLLMVIHNVCVFFRIITSIDLVAQTPDNDGRMVVILNDKFLHLLDGVFLTIAHVGCDVGNLCPDDLAIYITKIIEILIMLIMCQPDGSRTEFHDHSHIFFMVLRQKGIADAVTAVQQVNRLLGRTAYALDIYGPVDPGQTEWFEALQKDFPEYKLELYGDGEDKEMLSSLARELNLDGRVVFCGNCKDVLERIKTASLFAFSSDYEGLPNALAEALAIGLPCVSTDCTPGGARMLIDNGENGFIVPVNQPKPLADEMKILLSDKELSEKFSKNAVLLREKASLNRIVDMWEDYLSNIVR